MRSSIPYYILTLLDLEGQVRIPGVGKLTRSIQPAHVDLETAVISPPSASSNLNYSGSEKGKLLERFVAYQTGKDRLSVKSDLKRFGKEILTDIDRNGQASFHAFGTFTRVNGQIVFSPDADVMNARFHGLSPVAPLTHRVELPATPVVETVEPSVIATAVAAPSTARPERKRRGLPLALIALIALVLMTCIFAFVQYKMRQAALAEQLLFNRSPVAERIPDSTNPAERQILIPEISEDSSEKDVVEEPSRLSEEPPTDETDPDKSESTELSIVPDVESGKQPCLVVIGAFGMQDNVDRMIQRLSDMGLDAETIPRGKLTVVGVPTGCSGTEMEARLSRLRSSIEPTAWVLKR